MKYEAPKLKIEAIHIVENITEEDVVSTFEEAVNDSNLKDLVSEAMDNIFIIN